MVLMSKSQLMQKKWGVGRQYAEMAQKTYPQEAQAYHLSGFAKIQLKDYDGALEEFSSYDRVLPGNPNTRIRIEIVLKIIDLHTRLRVCRTKGQYYYQNG